jgi:hypothetical protein
MRSVNSVPDLNEITVPACVAGGTVGGLSRLEHEFDIRDRRPLAITFSDRWPGAETY